MKSNQNTIFPIKFNYVGTDFETKVLKHTYRQQLLYKIIIPSAVSEVQQCWLATNKDAEWKLIIGAIDKALMQHIITAIKKQEQILTIYGSGIKTGEQKLRSA
ncbi:hypothetical protein [Mucilaginibacter boryungensis]|uniref:Uncharacterized protein n=1 Tax=Mucilaginibacter boryungensis TaxID=768480 RepID=A0ABR9XJH3_9SPHI|nr:hypothetical protein [Mucilaginibacter boryungensis]MBE9667361.1 hypothetical protein [Mucilaginibacter boryungensis]